MNKKGFTLPEIMITVGIAAILLAIGTFNIFGAKHKASSFATIQMLVTDINQQRTKAMTGDTEGRSSADSYGVYFSQNSYVLFHGANYSSGDTYNFTVSTGDSNQFSNITFPQSQIVFTSGSGALTNFVSGSNTVRIVNTVTGEYKTLTINRLGTITQIN